SAQVPGVVDSIGVDEGDQVRNGQSLIRLNTEKSATQLSRQQAQFNELNSQIESVKAQVRQITAQLSLTNQTLTKTKHMLSDGAATQQQLDELITKRDVYRAQLDGLRAQKNALASKQKQLQAALRLTQIDMEDAHFTAPVEGTILNRLKEKGEFAAIGQPLLDIADLSLMEAQIYVPLVHLDNININQSVELTIDGREETFTGTVAWIASEAEFTPKTILTEDTRTTLVYAVKVRVANERGILKIGMPVQVHIGS
ncbi:MAG: efflux RND transporter periplasmic adaptor subunit, partial [Caldithrix sp.]|nr:efflux RND transporter periplasmic adaptor subunit [Caldithrix sp.]